MAQPKIQQVEDFLGSPYNYDTWEGKPEEYKYFRSVAKAGEMTPDFTLSSLDGGDIKLSSLRGKPVVMEFGSIT